LEGQKLEILADDLKNAERRLAREWHFTDDAL